MPNVCQFSDCRKYRYSLLHQWDELFERNRCVFICLNPSTADEITLDNTLTRIKSFSQKYGFNEFLMLNIFAFRATDPNAMKAAEDPIGPDNDRFIDSCIRESAAIQSPSPLYVIGGWGAHGNYLGRAGQVVEILLELSKSLDLKTKCFGFNADNSPKHPLYLRRDTPLLPMLG